jgi:hypothetical protein
MLYYHITFLVEVFCMGFARDAQGAGLARSLKLDRVLQLLLNPLVQRFLV